MVQPRKWSETEFSILLENPHLSDEVLAHKLTGHTTEGVAQIRDMAHTYHTEGRISEVRGNVAADRLIEMGIVVPRLKRERWTCARCGKKY